MTRRGSVPRVLVLPQEIAGVASGLVRGLRQSGVEADLLVRGRHPFEYARPEPSTHFLARLQQLLTLLAEMRGPLRPLALATSLLLRTAAFPVLLLRYDAFLYLGPTTLTGLAIERRVARALHRTVVTVFLGSDARPPYLSGYVIVPEGSGPDLDAVRRQVRATARRVRSAEASSNWVVNHPPTAGFHRRAYVDFSTMGLPTPEVTAPPRVRGEGHSVRILHAPSMAPWKGTDKIRAAVAQLRDVESLPIEYVELAGVPHAQVIAALAGADLVVDELYSDAILAGLATEAAALGATPLVFGYAGPSLAETARTLGVGLRHYHPPEQLVDALRAFVTDAGLRAETATAVHDFVIREWSTAAIGARYARLLTKGPDPSWLRDPAESAYVDGWGVDRETRRAFLRRLLATGSPADLELPPGSALLNALLTEAESAG